MVREISEFVRIYLPTTATNVSKNSEYVKMFQNINDQVLPEAFLEGFYNNHNYYPNHLNQYFSSIDLV